MGVNRPPERVAYLGPPGTYSELALESLSNGWRVEGVPYPSILRAFEACVEHETAHVLVPVENSIEGPVTLSIDLFIEEEGLEVEAESVVAVHNVLLGHDQPLAQVERILSHPQPLAQCRRTLRRLCPGASMVETSSTMAAAEAVRAHGPGWAAVAAPRVAQRLGLVVLAPGVSDYPDNLTRFWLLGRGRPGPTGNDCTSLVFTLPEDRPGGLYEVLGEFAVRSLNLSRVETRPSKLRLGQYRFLIDVEGHATDPGVAAALAAVAVRAPSLRVLGSYPRAR